MRYSRLHTRYNVLLNKSYNSISHRLTMDYSLHLSTRGVTTDPGSFPDCITTGCDWESFMAAQNCPSLFRIRVWLG